MAMIKSMDQDEFEIFLTWLDNRIEILATKGDQKTSINDALLDELLRKNTGHGRELLVKD